MSTIEMQPETAEVEAPLWDDTKTVGISHPGGTEQVPAMTHPWCPGLAVTMRAFGQFVVTHVTSGRKLGGEYERAFAAAVELVEWAAIARDGGFSWEADADAVVAAVKERASHPVPFEGATSTSAGETRPLTVGEWMGMVRHHLLNDEFPWESYEDSPTGRCDELLKTLAPSREARHA